MTAPNRAAIDRMTRCYFCGNEAARAQPLVPSDDHPGFREHRPVQPCAEAIDARGEPRVRSDGTMRCGHDECSPDWTCPEPPDGWGQCGQCYRARPVDDLLSAERRVGRNGQLNWFTIIHDPEQARLICSDGCREWVRVLRDRKQVTARKVDRDDDTRQDEDQEWADAVPDDGLTIRGLADLWDVSVRTARDRVARLIEASLLVSQDVPTRAGGKPRKVYSKVPA
jgi:hypothetical protein